jgi:hypothetical protein
MLRVRHLHFVFLLCIWFGRVAYAAVYAEVVEPIDFTAVGGTSVIDCPPVSAWCQDDAFGWPDQIRLVVVESWIDGLSNASRWGDRGAHSTPGPGILRIDACGS